MSLPPWPKLTEEQWREKEREFDRAHKVVRVGKPPKKPGVAYLGKFNPNHRPPGPGGGQFAPSEGGGGSALPSLFERISKPDGGFTYQPRTDYEPPTGYAVSIYPERSLGIDADKLQFSDLVDYAIKNQDLFEKMDHYIGAWHNPETHRVFLDVSVVKSTAQEAEALCRQHDQISFFDLGGGKSITVNPEATSGGAAKSYGGRSEAGATARIGQGQDLDGRAPGRALREADREEADRAGAGTSPPTTRAVVRLRSRPQKPGVTYLDKFNPNHRPSGPGGGQFAPADEGGAGAGPSSDKYPSVVNGEDQLVKSHDEIRAFAEENGFPANRVDVGKMSAEAKADIKSMGLNPNRVKAFYDPPTKRLWVNEKGLGSMSRARARELVTHEVAHSRFADAMHGSSQGDVVEYLLDNRLPLLKEGLKISDYSTAWWTRVGSASSKGASAAFTTAVDESLAELSRLRAHGKFPTFAKLDKIVRLAAKA